MGAVLPEAAKVHDSEMRVDVRPRVRGRLTAVVPAGPGPAAGNERAGEDAHPCTPPELKSQVYASSNDTPSWSVDLERRGERTVAVFVEVFLVDPSPGHLGRPPPARVVRVIPGDLSTAGTRKTV